MMGIGGCWVKIKEGDWYRQHRLSVWNYVKLVDCWVEEFQTLLFICMWKSRCNEGEMWRIFLVVDLEALMLQHPMRSSRQEKSAELATQRGLCALQRCLLRRRLDMGDGLADCLEVGITDPQDQLFFIWIHLPSHSHCFLTTTQPWD